MYRLLEVTYSNNKELVAIYPTEGQEPFADVTALTAEFDTKMGAAIKAEAYKAELLVAFDDEGHIYEQGYDSKDAEVKLSPRLVFVTKTAEAVTANQSKEDSLTALKGDFFAKRGAAKKSTDVKGILLIGIDGKAVLYSDNWARPIEPVEPQEVEE